MRTSMSVGERRLNAEFRIGKSFLRSLTDCQVKGFVVMRGGQILAEFYDNGFNLVDANLLQSVSKTYAAVITHALLDFHDPGTSDQQWEVEIGLQSGECQGHVAAIEAAGRACAPGEAWNYTDKNTDTLALLAEAATGQRSADLAAGLVQRVRRS